MMSGGALSNPALLQWGLRCSSGGWLSAAAAAGLNRVGGPAAPYSTWDGWHGPDSGGSSGSSSSGGRWRRRAPSASLSAPAAAFSSSAAIPTPSAAAAAGASGPSEGPQALYDAGLASGTYRPDPLQAVTVRKLQALYDELRVAYPRPSRPSGLTIVDSVAVKQSRSSWLTGLSTLLQSSSGLAPQPGLAQARVRGLYMYGGVGCGKTMLMDMFVRAAPREFQVTRTHFHDFMLDVHSRLRHAAGEADPLARVADEIAVGTKVLALDELFVTDVADAMILARLFGRLWDSGLALVATSNRAPDRLYEGGLQRQLFLPFIARLKEQCVIHDMASPVDYRRLAQHQRGLYFVTPDRDEALYEAFLEAGGGVQQPSPDEVQVAMGRVLHVPDALGRAALFEFSDLCDRPVAAADFIALAGRYHTVALSGVPAFGPANRSAAYRFVTLVDVLYENRVKLLVSAEAMPFELFERVLTQDEWRRWEAGLGGGVSSGASGSAAHSASVQQHHGGSAQQQQHHHHQQQQRGAHTDNHVHSPASASASASGGSSGGGPLPSGGGGGDILVDNELGFAKDRTISRLTEMQSLEYLVAHAKAHEPSLMLALQEAVDAKNARQAAEASQRLAAHA